MSDCRGFPHERLHQDIETGKMPVPHQMPMPRQDAYYTAKAHYIAKAH
ncbi:MAG: hypothetical protein F6J90_20570 [Moorea sp. SIOASIH]|nr:hypothetical protein [Moorena sp. SIOASIH]